MPLLALLDANSRLHPFLEAPHSPHTAMNWIVIGAAATPHHTYNKSILFTKTRSPCLICPAPDSRPSGPHSTIYPRAFALALSSAWDIALPPLFSRLSPFPLPPHLPLSDLSLSFPPSLRESAPDHLIASSTHSWSLPSPCPHVTSQPILSLRGMGRAWSLNWCLRNTEPHPHPCTSSLLWHTGLENKGPSESILGKRNPSSECRVNWKTSCL